MTHPLTYSIAAAICVLAACSRGPSTSGSRSASASTTGPAHASNGSQWIANGRTACDKYLTPDVVAKILTHPAGQTKVLSSQGCTYEAADNGATISITLNNGGPATFKAMMPYLTNPLPLSGVGDQAVRSVTGIDAEKGADRGCSIDAGGAPGSTKLTGEPLAQQLGDICNKLFALP
jgi:hypothetical protein